MAEQLEVIDVPERHRFEILDDGQSVGFCDYHENSDGTVTLPHTVIDPSRRGRGLGDVLVKAAVEELRSRGLAINATCWFVAEYLEREEAQQA